MLGEMQAPTFLEHLSHGPDATEALGLALAPILLAGDTLCLVGGLGAGKSHLARTIIHALTGEHDIPSPTFTLVQTYETANFEIWHADLYRLSDPSELAELGLTGAVEDALCLIEWPDRTETLPDGALWITLEKVDHPESRRIKMSSRDERWGARLASLGPQADE